ENLDSVSPLPAEYKQMPAIRIPLQHVLHHHGEAIKSSPHVRRPAGDPDLRPRRHRNHRPAASSASAKRAAFPGATPSDRRKIRPLRSTTSMRATSFASLPVTATASLATTTATGAKRASP